MRAPNTSLENSGLLIRGGHGQVAVEDVHRFVPLICILIDALKTEAILSKGRKHLAGVAHHVVVLFASQLRDFVVPKLGVRSHCIVLHSQIPRAVNMVQSCVCSRVDSRIQNWILIDGPTLDHPSRKIGYKSVPM